MTSHTDRPLILVTNDDSITAPGIRALVSFVADMGDVWVVAPSTIQSGKGHAITLSDILRCKELPTSDGSVREFAVDGTPADCVKLAKNYLMPRIPDICLSGINHGSNAAINVIYSGTMAATIEAGLEGIPAVGFSLCDLSWEADFSPLREHIRDIVRRSLQHKLPTRTVLNVNFPAGEIKGVKVCRQAATKWEKEFEVRENPRGGQYFWMVGHPICDDDGSDTDEWALAHGYASIVPTTYDLTDYSAIPALKEWEY